MSETVRVLIGDDYYQGAYWYPGDDAGDRAHDIPVEQRDRWQQAMDAYEEMQAEIGAILEAQATEAAKGPARHTPITAVWSRIMADALKRRPSGGGVIPSLPGDVVTFELSPGRHTHIRPGETPSQADQRLLDGEDL